MTRFDVIVIGAGAAGLAAACELSAAGARTLVLEARGRLGGRILTVREPGSTVPAELGAEFIHGRPRVTFDWLARGAGHAVDAIRNHHTLIRGQFRERDGPYDRLIRTMRRHGTHGRDESLASFLAGSRLPADARTYARMMAEGFDAADPECVSAHSIIDEWLGEAAVGSPTFRPSHGYDTLIDTMARTLDPRAVRIQLRTVVESVHWRRGAAEIRGRYLGGAFKAHAERVIVTVPVGVLQAATAEPGAIAFDPALGAKRSALQGIASGGVIKVVLKFRDAFWESMDNGRLRNVSFFHAASAEFPTYWTLLPVRSTHLIAWAGGPRVNSMANDTDEALIRRALKSAQSVFQGAGDLSAQVERADTHHWQRDPFARGAYSYQLVGAADARKELAKPVQSTLYFAGEATDFSGQAATVAGALESGRVAACSVLRAAGG